MTVETVLVAGANGRRGRAVVDAVLAAGFDVYVLVPDPERADARALTERGATLVRGRRDQLDHVDDAVARADADALLARPGRDDAQSVLERGRTLARAAERAGVDHAVFTSVGNAGTEPGVPAVDAAASVEDVIRERDVSTTVLRTHLPMQGLERRRSAVRERGDLVLPLEWGARATLSDAADVGRLAAHVFDDPDTFADETYELVGDRLSLPEIAEAVSDVIDREIDYSYGGPDAAPDGRSAFYRWVNEGGLGADVETGVDVPDFESTGLREYLVRAGWGRDAE